MIKALRKKGYGIDIITAVPHYPDGNESSTKDMKMFRRFVSSQVNVLRFWMPSVSHKTRAGRILNYVLFSMLSSIGTLLVRKPDIIFAQSPNFFVWFPGLAGKMLRRTPLVANVDDLWPEALEDLGIVKSSLIISFVNWLRRICLTLADHIVCISDSITKAIISNNIHAHKVSTVEVGYDFEGLGAVSSTHKAKATNDLTVVYSGILGPAYDFSAIIDLAGCIVKMKHAISFVIKGRGPELEGVRKLVTKSKLDNIEINDSWMEVEKYNDFMRSADVFILPMQDNYISTTALPTKLFEYMAFAKPVIVVGQGEVANIVNEAGCGIAVKRSQLDEAIKFLTKLADGKIEGANLGYSGRMHIKQNLSLEIIGDKFSKIFQTLFRTCSE